MKKYSSVVSNRNLFNPIEITSWYDLIIDPADHEKEIINSIRESTSSDQRSDLKRTLPCVQFGSEPGVIFIDIDDVKDVEEAKQIASSFDFVEAAYVSPSGRGIHVTAKVDENEKVENPRKVFEVVKSFFEEKGLNPDKSCKDLNTRLTLLSHDPNIILNENPRTLTSGEINDIHEKIVIKEKDIKRIVTNSINNYSLSGYEIDDIIATTANDTQYPAPGSSHEFIKTCTIRAKVYGYPKEVLMSHLIQEYPFLSAQKYRIEVSNIYDWGDRLNLSLDYDRNDHAHELYMNSFKYDKTIKLKKGEYFKPNFIKSRPNSNTFLFGDCGIGKTTAIMEMNPGKNTTTVIAIPNADACKQLSEKYPNAFLVSGGTINNFLRLRQMPDFVISTYHQIKRVTDKLDEHKRNVNLVFDEAHIVVTYAHPEFWGKRDSGSAIAYDAIMKYKKNNRYRLLLMTATPVEEMFVLFAIDDFKTVRVTREDAPTTKIRVLEVDKTNTCAQNAIIAMSVIEQIHGHNNFTAITYLDSLSDKKEATNDAIAEVFNRTNLPFSSMTREGLRQNALLTNTDPLNKEEMLTASPAINSSLSIFSDHSIVESIPPSHKCIPSGIEDEIQLNNRVRNASERAITFTKTNDFIEREDVFLSSFHYLCKMANQAKNVIAEDIEDMFSIYEKEQYLKATGHHFLLRIRSDGELDVAYHVIAHTVYQRRTKKESRSLAELRRTASKYGIEIEIINDYHNDLDLTDRFNELFKIKKNIHLIKREKIANAVIDYETMESKQDFIDKCSAPASLKKTFKDISIISNEFAPILDIDPSQMMDAIIKKTKFEYGKVNRAITEIVDFCKFKTDKHVREILDELVSQFNESYWINTTKKGFIKLAMAILIGDYKVDKQGRLSVEKQIKRWMKNSLTFKRTSRVNEKGVVAGCYKVSIKETPPEWLTDSVKASKVQRSGRFTFCDKMSALISRGSSIVNKIKDEVDNSLSHLDPNLCCS